MAPGGRPDNLRYRGFKGLFGGRRNFLGFNVMEGFKPRDLVEAKSPLSTHCCHWVRLLSVCRFAGRTNRFFNV